MMDTLVVSEGEPDLLQISGGEPTIHPDILTILRMAKQRPIRHLMLNTNGIRIARDPDFVAQLAEFTPGFEVYLQFDSLQRDAADADPRRRPAQRAPAGAGEPRAPQHLHHPGRRAQEGRQ